MFRNMWQNKLVRVFIFYISSIFIFAVIYKCLPSNSFYHSTVKYERTSFNKDVDEIITELTADLKNLILNNIPDDIDLANFTIYSISFNDYPQKIKINYHIGFIIRKKSNFDIEFNDSISVDLNTFLKIGDQLYLYYSKYNNDFIINNVLPIFEYNKIFSNEVENFIPVSDYIDTRLIDIGKAYNGFPKKLSGQFFRMLYLSFGIATTMTMGDILPITNLARILIMLQNIITLIFLGFLIDAIIDRIKK
jgi:hypothetical protein